MTKWLFIATLIYTTLMACNTAPEKTATWCSQKLRPQLTTLTEVPVKSTWFKVYNVGTGVYAIAEPYNFEEVISYLITGKDSALLFDTGMGFDTISAIVKQLTSLPVTVINSHTHFDHTGGNAEFTNILALNTPYTIHNAAFGWPHSAVKDEVTPAAICLDKLPNKDSAAYHVRPFSISRFVADGYIIKLGGRDLEVVAAPGHTPDAIALLDRQNGYLFTGDTFYEATIWLFADGTNLQDYANTVAKLAVLQPGLKTLFTSHNTPIAQPTQLTAWKNAFDDVISGKAPALNAADAGYDFAKDAVVFKFNTFSFLIRKDQLPHK